jgi:hypothetical protein
VTGDGSWITSVGDMRDQVIAIVYWIIVLSSVVPRSMNLLQCRLVVIQEKTQVPLMRNLNAQASTYLLPAGLAKNPYVNTFSAVPYLSNV